jgi:hypothetical protein
MRTTKALQKTRRAPTSGLRAPLTDCRGLRAGSTGATGALISPSSILDTFMFATPLQLAPLRPFVSTVLTSAPGRTPRSSIEEIEQVVHLRPAVDFINEADIQLSNTHPVMAGGFGVVRRAMWNGSEVAVKYVSPELMEEHNPKHIEEFYREAAMLSSLHHPSVVRAAIPTSGWSADDTHPSTLTRLDTLQQRVSTHASGRWRAGGCTHCGALMAVELLWRRCR